MNDIEVIDNKLNNSDSMMLRVIESGNIGALEKYIELKDRESSRMASLEYDKQFALMQAEMATVTRGNQGHGYKYASLEDLQRQCGPILSKFGFSYAWDEEALQKGKRIILTISGHGHSRRNSFDVPALQGTQRMNAVQVAGAESSYGKRYSFISGFGVIIADEDTDAVPEAPATDVTDRIQRLKACKDLKELMKAWTEIYPTVTGDSRAIVILSAVKDQLKGELK